MALDSLWSLLQIAAGFGLSVVLGFGVAFALLPGQYRRYSLVVAPGAGYAIYSLVVILVSGNLHLSANVAVWIALAAMLAISAAAAAAAVRRDEARSMWRTAAPTLWALGLMVVMMFWPVLYQGAGLYLGTANPDFYQSLAYQEVLSKFGIGALDPRPAIDYTLNPFFGVFPDPIPAKFGGVMFSMLLEKLTGLPARNALMASLVVFLLALPFATYFFSKVVLELSDRVAAFAAVLMAVSGPTTMSFIHVLVGQNSSLALLPLALSVCYLAVATRERKLLVFSLLLLDAGFWIYVMILPYVAAPIGLYALHDAWRDRRQVAKWLWTAIAIIAGGFALLQLGMFPQAKQLVLDITSLLGRANRSVYVDYLTELSLPYSLGLTPYPLTSNLLLARLRAPDYVTWAGFFVAFAFLALAFYFRSVVAWARGASPEPRRFVLITLAVYSAVWAYFTFVSLYGYAIFKMASWLQFLFVPFVAYGLHALAREWRAPSGIGSRVAVPSLSAIGAALVVANVISSLDFDVKSLGKDTRKGAIINSYGIGGNADYPELAGALRRLLAPGEVVAIAMPDFIANLWTAYYVVEGGMRAAFVSHDDFPDEDAVLPDVVTGIVRNSAGQVGVYRPRFSSVADPPYYLLEGPGNLNQEIVHQARPLRPLWSDDSFALVAAKDAKDVVVTGRGFYRLEYFDRSKLAWWWPDRMRWTPEGGEILLLNASRPDIAHYLSFVAVAGKQREMPRHVELWLNGKRFDEIVVHGAARVVSKPFYPTGGDDKLVVKIREHVELTGRNFGLWNRQIATDQRYLNMVVAQVKVSSAAQAQPVPRGAFTAKDLIDRSRRFDGISLDGWAGRNAYVELAVPPDVTQAHLHITVPDWAGLRFPMRIRFVVNGMEVERELAGPGDQVIDLELPARSDALLIEMQSNRSTLVPGVGDESFIIRSLRLG